MEIEHEDGARIGVAPMKAVQIARDGGVLAEVELRYLDEPKITIRSIYPYTGEGHIHLDPIVAYAVAKEIMALVGDSMSETPVGDAPERDIAADIKAGKYQKVETRIGEEDFG